MTEPDSPTPDTDGRHVFWTVGGDGRPAVMRSCVAGASGSAETSGRGLLRLRSPRGTAGPRRGCGRDL